MNRRQNTHDLADQKGAKVVTSLTLADGEMITEVHRTESTPTIEWSYLQTEYLKSIAEAIG